MEKNQLLLEIARKNGTGEIGSDEMGALLSVLDGGPIMTVTSGGGQKQINAKTLAKVVDVEGNLLVAGQNYMFRDEKIKVLRERFGSGNALDNWYWVYYLGSDMEEHTVCVEVQYVGGSRGDRVYKSQFTPITLSGGKS